MNPSHEDQQIRDDDSCCSARIRTCCRLLVLNRTEGRQSEPAETRLPRMQQFITFTCRLLVNQLIRRRSRRGRGGRRWDTLSETILNQQLLRQRCVQVLAAAGNYTIGIQLGSLNVWGRVRRAGRRLRLQAADVR